MATIGVSVPSFLIAMIMLIVFGVQLHILPFIGLNSPLNYIMPALSLAFYPIAMIARLTRSSMLEVMNQDYIILARSKGTPYKKVVIKHALKNAMIPIVTLVGTELGYMLTGSMLIEKVFSIPGIGKLAVDAMNNRDLPLLQGTVVYIALVFVVVNLVVDISYAFIDPRIRFGKGAE